MQRPKSTHIRPTKKQAQFNIQKPAQNQQHKRTKEANSNKIEPVESSYIQANNSEQYKKRLVDQNIHLNNNASYQLY